MGLRRVCKFFCHRLFESLVVVLLIIFLPHLPPYTNISEPFSVSPAKSFEGKLVLNDKLSHVDIWHKGDFIGPEAFADYNGELYASLYGGDIVKLTNNHITPVVKTGKPCKGHYEERICGRPLGMEFDKNGILYVADAYYGIYRVNVKTGQKTLIISTDQKINGKKPKIPNNIALAYNGDIYWSDSSTEFYLEDGLFDLLADPSGRLIHYDSKTKQNTVLIEKLHFANGVALSDDEEFVLVAETARNRIHRYYLKGPKRGTRDIFIDGLPGLPDNLRSDGKGGFFVPIIIAVDADHPSPFQAIGPFPLIRKFVARVFGLTQMVFELLNRVYPCEFAQKGIHFIGHFTSTGELFVSKRATVLHVDKHGKILDSLHGLNKKISHICEVHIFKDTLYLGSPFNDYIARVPLSKIGWEHLAPERKKREVPVEQPKVRTTQVPTTTPTPTTTRTTTPRPTTTTTTTPRPTTTTTPRPTTARPTTTNPPPKQQTPPPKPQTTSPPPKQQSPPPVPKKESTTPPPPKQTPPPTVKTQTTPPPKQQTVPPTVKQQTPPPPKQQTPPTLKQQPAPPATKPQGAPPPPRQEAPPQKQTAPPTKQQTPPSQPKQESPPPSKPTPQKAEKVPPATEKPQAQTHKQSSPPVAQPIRDQPRSVPVN